MCRFLKKFFCEIFGLFNIGAELPNDAGIHIKAMKLLHEKSDSMPWRRPLFDHLYDCLSVIDQKSASLFTGNSVLAAVYAIFMTEATPAQYQWLGVGIFIMLLSSIILIIPIKIHWSTTIELGQAPADGKDKDKKVTENSAGIYANRLLSVRDERTRFYRAALLLSWFSVLWLGAYVFFNVLATF